MYRYRLEQLNQFSKVNHKDGGSELHKAVEVLELYESPSIDDISHAAANLLKHSYPHHPLFEHFLSACGRVSGKLKQTLLACLAPPTVHTKARFMNVHRLFTWADRLLQLFPPGGAKTGSMLARLRACMDELPACKGLIKRFRADAQSLLACQEVVKTQGLCHDALAQCQALITEMPSARIRQDFESLELRQDAPHVEFLSKSPQTPCGIGNVGLPDLREAADSSLILSHTAIQWLLTGVQDGTMC